MIVTPARSHSQANMVRPTEALIWTLLVLAAISWIYTDEPISYADYLKPNDRVPGLPSNHTPTGTGMMQKLLKAISSFTSQSP